MKRTHCAIRGRGESVVAGDSSGGFRADNSTEDEDVEEHHVRNLHSVSQVSSGFTDEQVYMGVMWHGGKLAVAYYDLDSAHIYLMLDSVETEDFSLLQRIIKQIQPCTIVMSSKQDERLMKTVKSQIEDLDEEVEDNSKRLQCLPSIDFSLEICKRRILNLDLPSIPQHFMDSERTLYLSSLIPFDNTCMVRAAGGLLKYLEKMRVGIELEESNVRVPVLNLKIFSLNNQVILDDTAYSALQIFQRESHPSVYKSGTMSSAKEGLSLFGMMNRCKSQIGSRMLRLWFLRPYRDCNLLKRRQDAIGFFVNPRNIEVLSTLQDCLKNIKNISRVMSRMVQAQASVADWQALYKTAYNAIYIGDVCRAQSQDIEIFKKISNCFNEDLHRIATLISKIVDFDESITQGRFVVKPNVDEDLDERKRTYNGLPEFMTKVAREELNNLSDEISECNVIYLPQIGYLLAIPKKDVADKQESNFDMPGLTFVFLSNNMVHYKSASTKELDQLLGDTQCEITDHETSIMHRLQNMILEHSNVLMDVMDLAAELDCLMSLADCAREFGYVRPTMVTNAIIEIKNGRHPLQELCCTPFVPNDTLSGEANSKMKILTGPNASGKSIYLKQVALIVFLAHTGSFVPAKSAVIGLVDRIYTRIRTLESVSVGLSSFMIDINQMSDSLRGATHNSLVIVDEFGKGTEMVDGLALLTSSLSFWLDKGDNCPHVFVSTHFHSLIQDKLLQRSPLLQYMTMETLHDGEELVFLYQLVEGHTNSSYASHIASQVGLPREIIKRGIEVSDLIQRNQPVHRVDSPGTDEQYKRCAKIVDRFLSLDLCNDDLKSFLENYVLPVSKGQL